MTKLIFIKRVKVMTTLHYTRITRVLVNSVAVERKIRRL